MKCIISILSITSLCVAKPLPDVKNLHSKNYTLQITIAEVKEGSSTNSYLRGTSAVPKNPLIERLENSNVTYTNYAIVYLKPNTDFVSENKLVSGMVSINEDQAISLELNIQYMGKSIPLTGFPLGLNEWSGFGLDSGGQLSKFMLIKLYEPQK